MMNQANSIIELCKILKLEFEITEKDNKIQFIKIFVNEE